ncbi:transmembrane emp24 domain-containing protein 1-like [Eucyclogobius newberryi]|uniref:transmembrane emp24 domain-containing protein 1-like n=1 Tax=Eucyclogobius newberryi TaxID=166745 RepID=UPI003B5C825A
MFAEAFLLLLLSSIDKTVSVGPKRDMGFTFILPAGSIECFYQPAMRGDTMEFEYQVVAGSGLDVIFSLFSPTGQRLVADFRKSDGIHTMDPTEDGDYRMCFDNSFSKMSLKMVYFEVMLNAQSGTRQEWDEADKEDSLLEYKLSDIRTSLETMRRHLERSRQFQAALRAFESRDRYLLEDNLWRVSFWSCLTLLGMLGVASAQIYTLKKLFDDKKCMRAKA